MVVRRSAVVRGKVSVRPFNLFVGFFATDLHVRSVVEKWRQSALQVIRFDFLSLNIVDHVFTTENPAVFYDHDVFLGNDISRIGIVLGVSS